VRSILAAERSVRKVHGVIVFDAGTRIRWDGTPGPARPGYGGVAGMFSELLGVSNLVPMAALSGEIYLPHDPDAPLNAAIAGYIRRRVAVGEQGDALLAMLTQGIELTPDQASRLQSEVARLLAAAVGLDEAMEAVLASVGIDLPVDGGDGHRVTALDPGRPQEMVTQLMMERNKVTHIYELVKAYGSTMQIRYNRPDKRWDRVEALVEKHAREYAVNLFDGAYGPGEGHAPMVYAGDPRQDVPSALRQHLTQALRDRDATIVKGWLEGIAEGGAEDLGLE
jgi:hypothetical protein